jgi:plasmid stabilization system protein ParE
MTYRLIIRLEAETDIANAAIWYQSQRDGLGEEFVAEVQTAVMSAVANPRRYPRLRRKPEVRRVLTKRFPYRVFFVLRPDTVVVFRVLHGAGHDREWNKTIPPD